MVGATLNRRMVPVPKHAAPPMDVEEGQRGGGMAAEAEAAGGDGAACGLCLRRHSGCPLKLLHASLTALALRVIRAEPLVLGRSGATHCGDATRDHRAVRVIAERAIVAPLHCSTYFNSVESSRWTQLGGLVQLR
jgi:hypothetical protein